MNDIVPWLYSTFLRLLCPICDVVVFAMMPILRRNSLYIQIRRRRYQAHPKRPSNSSIYLPSIMKGISSCFWPLQHSTSQKYVFTDSAPLLRYIYANASYSTCRLRSRYANVNFIYVGFRPCDILPLCSHPISSSSSWACISRWHFLFFILAG